MVSPSSLNVGSIRPAGLPAPAGRNENHSPMSRVEPPRVRVKWPRMNCRYWNCEHTQRLENSASVRKCPPTWHWVGVLRLNVGASGPMRRNETRQSSVLVAMPSRRCSRFRKTKVS